MGNVGGAFLEVSLFLASPSTLGRHATKLLKYPFKRA